jgi:RNA polymerase sigma factor for flagellar operon FliA
VNSRKHGLRRSRRVSREHVVRRFESPEALLATWHEFKATGNAELRNRLVEQYLYLVRFAAERIGAKLPDEVDVDDLMSAGIFGLVDAIEAFDLARGVKFETYCAPRIRGAILDELRSMDWVPRLVRHRAHKLEETVRALEIDLGRAPSEEEVARRMNLSRPQYEKLVRDASAVSLVSLSQRFSDTDSEREVAETDVGSPDGPDPLADAHKHDLREIVTHGLTRAEKLIVVLYYYEQMTMKEIGLTLDLSESRVSQMHSAILERLRARLLADSKTSEGTRANVVA